MDKFKNLPAELKEKARACETSEELVALLEGSGVELSEEELAAVSGGFWSCPDDGDCYLT